MLFGYYPEPTRQPLPSIPYSYYFLRRWVAINASAPILNNDRISGSGAVTSGFDDGGGLHTKLMEPSGQRPAKAGAVIKYSTNKNTNLYMIFPLKIRA